MWRRIHQVQNPPSARARARKIPVSDHWKSQNRLAGSSVLIADDQDLVREGLRMLLESEPDLRVAGEAGNGRQALAQARRLDPDVILMDVRMPEMDGIEATAKLVAGGCRAAARGHGRHGARYVLLARCGRSTVKFTHRAWMIPAAHRTSPMTRPTVA
jgi:CheY-like chemotaxis protein